MTRYYGPFTEDESLRISDGFFRVSRPSAVKDPNDVSQFSFGFYEKDNERMWVIPEGDLNISQEAKDAITIDDTHIDQIYGSLITPEEKMVIKDKILNQSRASYDDLITSSAEILSRKKTEQWLYDNGWLNDSIIQLSEGT